MAVATSDEQAALAQLAGTSKNYLYQLAKQTRVASAELAAAIEKASHIVARRSKGRLPKLPREQLCPACSTCPYQKKCNS